MVMLFKILSSDGEACHGGVGAWPLPKGKRPGAWVEVESEPKVCERGLHLVRDPMRWYKPGTRLFVAEPDLTLPMSHDGSEKAAFKRARLLYEVTESWPLLRMFPQALLYLVSLAGARGDEEARKRLIADLRSADLSSADLSSADLSSADLSSADLSSADLRSADLRSADLSFADLRSANLSSADLRSANLRSADLRSANLRSADLSSADLRFADLRSANLRSAYRPENVPVGWKADTNGFLVRE